MVGSILLSPEQLSSPSAQPKKRQRWDVTGAHNLQFNTQGVFYRGTNKVRLTGKYGHLIDLGDDYSGPVPTAYGTPVTGGYLADPDDTESEQLEYNRLRRASEVIAYETLGRPPGGWVGAWVKHLDNDPTNLAPLNLQWTTAVHPNINRHNMIKGNMVSDIERSRRANSASRGGLYRPQKAKPPGPYSAERLDVPMRPRIMHHHGNRVAANNR